jgi:catechol 2,3-dioxygenase-like lactoylglutathione lyase family enzyme
VYRAGFAGRRPSGTSGLRAVGQRGRPGGIVFGFRLTDPAHIAGAIRAVKAAGGTILDHGEFVPGEPYVFFRDPDGYEVEIWFEIPTPVDPKPVRRPHPRARRRR